MMRLSNYFEYPVLCNGIADLAFQLKSNKTGLVQSELNN